MWSLLLLLLVVVLVPTGGVSWFMHKAAENERLAVRQKLEQAYRGHLAVVRDRLEKYWSERLAEIDGLPGETPGADMFARLVRSGLADSVICYGERGRLAYPAPPQVPQTPNTGQDPMWIEARRLENSRRDFPGAAKLYASIAAVASSPDEAARALQAQSRCYLRAGQREAAIHLVAGSLGLLKYARAADLQGRLVAADGELMALQLMQGPQDRRFLPIAERLRRRLLDYGNPSLSAAQRRFLMKQMQALPLPPELIDFPTLEAEELAARYLESTTASPREPVIRRSALPGVWELASPQRRAAALFREEKLHARMLAFLDTQESPSDVAAALVPPDAEPHPEGVFHSLPAAPQLPGWRLTLSFRGQDLLDAAADRQAVVYLWIGGLVIAGMAVLALAIAGAIRHQMRLTRLKNDLVATVTHELKTPLSSMRLLVDTLLEEERSDPRKVREYLQLISMENSRLSRLIDNFLAFSRMERNKHAFEFRLVEAAEIVQSAAEAAGERFEGPECTFTVDIAPDLPRVLADPDSIVTAILNLLNNAYKYSRADKRIALRAYQLNGDVCFEVEDNGIGLSARDAKKVFRRFYQVDQCLSRSAGGVGLGLSIVEFIVKAHGGAVRVDSRLGKGSKFTISIPGCRPEGESPDPRRIPWFGRVDAPVAHGARPGDRAVEEGCGPKSLWHSVFLRSRGIVRFARKSQGREQGAA